MQTIKGYSVGVLAHNGGLYFISNEAVKIDIVRVL